LLFLLLIVVGCGRPRVVPATVPATAQSVFIGRVTIRADGASPEGMEIIAHAVAQRMQPWAAHITTISTFDTSEIYVFAGAKTWEELRQAMSDALRPKDLPAKADFSAVEQVAASALPANVRVLHMRTVAITMDRDAMGRAGVMPVEVAEAIRAVYPGGPATDETLDRLKGVSVKTATGMVPIVGLVRMTLQESSDPIVHSYP